MPLHRNCLTFAAVMLFSMLNHPSSKAAESDFNAEKWRPVDNPTRAQSNVRAGRFTMFEMPLAELKHTLDQQGKVISVPLPDGEFAQFRMTPSQVMHPDLAAKYPNIQTFRGVELGNPQNVGNFDITSHGFHGMFVYRGKTVMLDPALKGTPNQYVSYFKHDALPLDSTIRLQAPRKKRFELTNAKSALRNKPSIAQRKRFRIAISASGEYSRFQQNRVGNGSIVENTLAALVTMVNRVNQVYTRDINIEFQLVADNDKIIFTDPRTDPFVNNSDEIGVDLEANQGVIDNAIGAKNYDIGHLVIAAGGGLASFGVVCTSFKAEGVSGSQRPVNDAFWIDFVAHEIGHQFKAEHTFSGNQSSCSGNAAANSAYEPGSGTTIMSYAGICGNQNIQSRADDNFHVQSIDQMTRFLTAGSGRLCGETLIQTNTGPTVDAGADYTIPANTPFTLNGTASDPNNDPLSYSWEQFDLADLNDLNNSTKGPLFRVFSPSHKGATRTFPKLSDIVAGTRTLGEKLPDQARELNFHLVVRDGKGGVNDDAMKVTVVDSRGFKVTEPTAGTNWVEAEQRILWDTAGTTQAPVACEKVNISLSSDGGQNFNQTLANQVANSGTATVRIPDIDAQAVRVKVACSNNIFFAINNANIAITRGNIKPVFTGQRAISVEEDNSLTLSAEDFSFVDNLQVDSISALNGNNYTARNLRITPAANFNGTLTVAVTASKGTETSDTFNATITVNPVNDPPVANNDSLTVQQNATATRIDVLSNDSDVDGGTLTLGDITYSGSGTATTSGNSISYTPANGFNGTETITYQVNDDNGGSASATLTIRVNAPTPPPAAASGGGTWMWQLLLLLWLVLVIRVKA